VRKNSKVNTINIGAMKDYILRLLERINNAYGKNDTFDLLNPEWRVDKSIVLHMRNAISNVEYSESESD